MKKFLPLLLFFCFLLICMAPSLVEAPPETDPATAAEALGEKYGIQILTGEDAIILQPWDYHFTAESGVNTLLENLAVIDQCLAAYPHGMLKVLSDDCGGLTICLVKEILGNENTGSLQSARGLQFRDSENRCYLVLAKDPDYTLYHELCHLIEDFVLPRSSAWDHWEALNPEGFSYDEDFEKNLQRDEFQYLESPDRAFIDTYSMSYPREDRARIMEYAMTKGNRQYFTSPTMQKKLKVLSQGIREAFGMQDFSSPLLWEQYLNP